MTIMRETSRPHRGKQHDHTAEKTLNTNNAQPLKIVLSPSPVQLTLNQLRNYCLDCQFTDVLFFSRMPCEFVLV